MKPQLYFYHVIWKIRNLENFQIFKGFEACISNIIHKKYLKVKQPNVVYIYMTWSTSVLCIGPSVSNLNPIWSFRDSHLCPSSSLSESVSQSVSKFYMSVIYGFIFMSAQIWCAKLWTEIVLIFNRNGYFSLSKRWNHIIFYQLR